MATLPVLVRELRRLVRADITWVWMIAIGLGLRFTTDGRESGATWAAPAAIALALFWAHRTMRAELDGETIEHLGTLPIHPFSLLLQVGLGSALAACLYAQPILWLTGRVQLRDLDAFARAACLAVSAGWMGAMGGFQFGGNFLESGFHMTWMGAMLSVLGSLLIGLTILLPLPQAMGFALAGGAVMAGCVFAAWRLTGGHWIESLLPDPTASLRAAAEAEHAVPSQVMSLTPDGVPPLAWHELRGHPYRVAFVVVVPALLMAALGALSRHGIAESFGYSMLLAADALVPLTLALTIASNVADLRRQGLWDDLTVAPVSAHAIVLGHVGVTVATLLTSLGLWMAVWYGVAQTFTEQTLAGALMLTVMVVGSSLSGFLGGALTTGWRAGLLSLAIGAVGLAAFMIPVMSYHGRDPHIGWVLAPGALVLGALYLFCVARVNALREGV